MTSSSEPEVVDILAQVPQGEDVGLGRIAKAAQAKANLMKGMVEEIKNHLATEPVHGKIRNFYVPPSWQEVFAGAHVPDNDRGWFVQSVEYFKSIFNKYKDGNFDPAAVEQDILRISTEIIYFSSWVNYMDSCATRAKSDREQSEYRAMMEVRAWADEHGVSSRMLGLDVMKALAAEATQDMRDFDDTFRIVSATIKGFYYSLKSFLEYLDRLSQRAQHERWEAKKHGDMGRGVEPPPAQVQSPQTGGIPLPGVM